MYPIDLIFFFKLHLFVSGYLSAYHGGMYAVERTTCRSHVSPPAMWVLGHSCVSRGLEVSSFAHWAIWPASYWLWWYRLFPKENSCVFGLSKYKIVWEVWEWVEIYSRFGSIILTWKQVCRETKDVLRGEITQGCCGRQAKTLMGSAREPQSQCWLSPISWHFTSHLFGARHDVILTWMYLRESHRHPARYRKNMILPMEWLKL